MYFFVLIAVFLAPITAAAYTVTDARAYRVNDTTALFYIDYAFGHENHDFYLPVLAVRDQAFGTEAKSIGYEVVINDDYATDDGSARAIVLADLPIEHGMYKIPKGYSAPFTLAVVYTTDPTAAAAEYAIQVTDLPFYSDDELTYYRLNPSELQYYVTDQVVLNNDEVTVTVELKNVTYTVLE